jgi:hypothetical protein
LAGALRANLATQRNAADKETACLIVRGNFADFRLAVFLTEDQHNVSAFLGVLDTFGFLRRQKGLLASFSPEDNAVFDFVDLQNRPPYFGGA